MQQFEKIKGNYLVKDKLKKALNFHTISNSILFSGPQGVGKTLFAKELAAHLMYPNGIDGIALKKIQNGIHVDLQILEPEGKARLHSINAMREMIENLSLKPYEGFAKVFIICDAERMLPYSSNALLKTLEEPNFDSYIILITSALSEMLPTIVSRLWHLNFVPNSEEEIVSVLKERCNLPTSDAIRLAKNSQGSIGRALSLEAINNMKEVRSLFFQLLHAKAKGDLVALMDTLHQIDALSAGDDPTKSNLCFYRELEESILMWQRDLALIANKGDRSLLLFKEEETLFETQLKEQKSFFPLHSLLDEMRLSEERNVKLRNALENFFLKIT